MGESGAQAVVRDGERSAWPESEATQVLTGDLPVIGSGRRAPAGRHATHIRHRIRSAATAVSLRIGAAVAEEQEYGHGFVLIPVVLALGSLAWLALPETVGTAKLAALLCVFGISAVLCRGDLRNWRPLLIAPALFTAGMLLAAAETARRDTVILDTPDRKSVV